MVQNLPVCRKPRFSPWVRKIPWRRAWLPTPVFLPGESHGQRSLTGYSPRSCKQSDRLSNWHTHVQLTAYPESDGFKGLKLDAGEAISKLFHSPGKRSWVPRLRQWQLDGEDHLDWEMSVRKNQQSGALLDVRAEGEGGLRKDSLVSGLGRMRTGKEKPVIILLWTY